MRLIRLLKNDLARETDDWVAQGIIDQGQAEQICAHYGVDFHQVRNRSLGYNVLVTLAYLFVGLAVITLLGANWENIPRGLRMGGLVILTVVVQAFGLRKYLRGDPDGAATVFFLGNLLFGAAIILIAQIYHLGEHMPDGVFWWALGSLPFALLTLHPWLTLQAMVLALIWFLIESGMGFYPALFPLFVAASAYALLRGPANVLLLLACVAGIALYFEYTLAELWREQRHYRFQAEHVGASLALFILLQAFSDWLAQRPALLARDYAAILKLWSLRFALLFLLVMSFASPWEALLEAPWNHLMSLSLIVAALLAGALGLAVLSGRFVPLIYWLVLFLGTLTALILSADKNHAVFFQVLANIVAVTTGIYLLWRGLTAGISHYFFLGVATLLLVAMLRYMDLIGDYIGGTLLFLLFAALLLAAAKFWQRQQQTEDHV